MPSIAHLKWALSDAGKLVARRNIDQTPAGGGRSGIGGPRNWRV